jgi:O-antigen ligase
VPAKRSSQPDRFLFLGLLAILLWLPLPWGSHSNWAVSLAGTAVFGLLTAWWSMAFFGVVELPKQVRRLQVPLLIWLLWLAWVAIQAVGLSPASLATLSPASAAIHEPVALLADRPPIYSLSIAPGITWSKWIESGVYFGLYFLTVLTVRSDGRLRRLLITLTIAGLVQAFYGSLMVTSGAEYGWLVKKEFYTDSATGTFVNRNHFAGYLEMTAAAAIALVLADLRASSGDWRWRTMLTGLLDLVLSIKFLARLSLVVMAVGLVLSRSRMGNLAFFACVSVGGLAYVLLRERQLFFKALIFFASILVVDILLVSEKFGLERVIERIDATRPEQEVRVKLLSEIGPVIGAYGLTGSGLGTFSLAYEPYRSEAMTENLDHAHNDYIEFLVETGIVGVALLGALLAWHARHAARVIFRRQHRLKVAACFSTLIAMFALGIHSAADFNFQIPANAGTFVVLLAMVAGCSDRTRRRSTGQANEQGRVAAGADSP